MGTTSTSLQGMLSNPGLPATAALYQTSTMVLFTALDKVATVVDGAPPGKNGRLFIVEPNKPVKVPYEAGRFIIEHLGYTGVVRVNEQEKLDDEGNVIGIEYDVATARDESLAKGKEQDSIRWQRFISDMVTDFVKQSKPVPPPPEAIVRIIERRGYRMQDYGVKPIGFQDPVDMKQAAMESENATLRTQVNDLMSKMDLLIKQGSGREAIQEAKDENAKDSDANVQDMPAANRPSGGGKPRSRR